MEIPGITWKGESIEDVAILRELPADLVRVLSDTNGLFSTKEQSTFAALV
jgi:hypothetical protein